jgi:hypothetical protein
MAMFVALHTGQEGRIGGFPPIRVQVSLTGTPGCSGHRDLMRRKRFAVYKGARWQST